MSRVVDRIEVINFLIDARGYRRYLEIGCQYDVSFHAVRAAEKVGVDPASGGTLRMPSDEFFALAVEPFDVVLIDGDHHHDQVFRDVCHALRLLRPGGVVVMHDCLPPTAGHEALSLCGTAWRAFAKTRERPDIESFTGDFDFGVGIVQKRRNSAPVRIDRPMAALTYADFTANREAWMRPLSPDGVKILALTGPDAW